MVHAKMKKILWVEDEKDLIRSYSLGLDGLYSISYAENYENALIKIKKEDFDLYIIDLVLPVGKRISSFGELLSLEKRYMGIELIKMLNKEKNYPSIIVLTVASNQNLLERIQNKINSPIVLSKYDINSKILEETVNQIMFSSQ